MCAKADIPDGRAMGEIAPPMQAALGNELASASALVAHVGDVSRAAFEAGEAADSVFLHTEDQTMTKLMRKSEFAKRCNVDKSRVSQWLKAKQIDGAAIVGEGRGAMVDAAVALKQLKFRLSVDERFGLNGLGTNLDWWQADDDVDGDDDGLAEAEADRRHHVTLYDAKAAIDDLWVFMDLSVQAALKPHPEAAATYQALRPRLADAKWRAQGVEPPC